MAQKMLACSAKGCNKTFKASGVGASYHATWTGHEVPGVEAALKVAKRQKNKRAKRAVAKQQKVTIIPEQQATRRVAASRKVVKRSKAYVSGKPSARLA